MLVLAMLLAACAGARARVFNVTYIDIPEIVPPEQKEVDIECHYDGDFTLLSWFKGSQEFFRYKPGTAPTIRSFPVIGVGSVEILMCGPVACQLRLGALTEQATGLYRCDIERDVPPYQFATMTGHMEVQGHEDRKPLLEGFVTEYEDGGTIEAYCRGGAGSEFRWYINGEEFEEFIGLPHFKKPSRRYLFMGQPPTMVLQCAEFRHGQIYGSVSKKAYWHETRPEKLNKVKENEVENGTRTNTGILGLLSIFLYFLAQVFFV